MTDRDWLLAAVVVAVGLVLVGPLLMWAGMLGVRMMGGGMWGAGPAGQGWLWAVGLLLPLGLVVAVVALGALTLRAVTQGRSESDPAIEELRAAYARGDLSDDEYERRLQRLRDGDTSSGN